MGLWAAIKKSINSNLNTPLNTLIANVQTTANTINTNTARGAVRSIQRGTTAFGTPAYRSRTISISALANVSKAKVLINGTAVAPANTNAIGTLLPYLYSLTATSLVLAWDGNYDGADSLYQGRPVSWQVIEYY